MPYIVLEGVAAGLPMVATEVGGIPEIFGALAPRLVPPGAPHLLAAAMEAQLDDPARARADAEALRASIRDRFSIETMARSVEALYAKALEGT